MPSDQITANLLSRFNRDPASVSVDDARVILGSVLASKIESALDQFADKRQGSLIDTVSDRQVPAETEVPGTRSVQERSLPEIAAECVSVLLVRSSEKISIKEHLDGVLEELLQNLGDKQRSLLLSDTLGTRVEIVAAMLRITQKEAKAEWAKAKAELEVAAGRLIARTDSVEGSGRRRYYKNEGAQHEHPESARPKLDSKSDLWHSKEEMIEISVTEDGRETNYLALVAEALSRLDESELDTVFGGLSKERLGLIVRVAVDLPSVAVVLERENPGLGTAVRQMLVEGAESLTRDELRKLQTFAANRLKEEGVDQRVKERAIAEDIFPPASVLFPERITSPSDVNANSLTALFRERAENPVVNVEALSEEQLLAIKDLSQAWRKHFWHVKYREKPANLTPDGKNGLKYRTPGRQSESMGTNKFWPKLDFRPDNT